MAGISVFNMNVTMATVVQIMALLAQSVTMSSYILNLVWSDVSIHVIKLTHFHVWSVLICKPTLAQPSQPFCSAKDLVMFTKLVKLTCAHSRSSIC